MGRINPRYPEGVHEGGGGGGEEIISPHFKNAF
jgi:hypothetical protein